MQDIHIIAESLTALAPYRALGRWHHQTGGAGAVYAVCEPRERSARARLMAAAGLTVLPAVGDPTPLPIVLVGALAAHGAVAADTARSLCARLCAQGVTIFDPNV